MTRFATRFREAALLWEVCAQARMIDGRTLALPALWIAILVTPVSAQSNGLQLVPVPPCRIMDTRNPTGLFGGPLVGGGSTRSVPIPSSPCSIPNTAAAYSLNITVVPHGALGYLTIWPSGQSQPVVSTLNSLDSSIVSNAAIVPAGTNGAVNVFATDDTDVVIDINAYFTAPGTGTLQFYPLAPCRVLDTRSANGTFGGPFLAGTQRRSFPIPTSPCFPVPVSPLAYSFNVTVVPHGFLGYLTAWPTGPSQPLVSTLNSLDGTVRAVAAIVPAGTSGAVSFFTTNDTDLVVDINGYFAPSGTGGLDFFTVLPCRVADTRNPNGPLGGPVLGAATTRAFPIPASNCILPATASAYSLNMTAVPRGPLGYLTTWPTGQTQPVVSTLNAPKGIVVANAALVPAGLSGSIDVFVTNISDLVIDTNGYFAASGGPATPPVITSFTPQTAPVGTLVTITGTNLQPNAGSSAEVTLAKQGGGTLTTPASSSSATTLTFVIPAGASTGALAVTVNGVSAPSNVPLTIVPASTLTLSASPSVGLLIWGQSTAYAVTLASVNGFNQLAALSLAGVPSGVTAVFNPPTITAGQSSVLTLTASANQPVGQSNLTITASATVQGLSVSQSTGAQLSVQAPTTSFLGRTVVSDSLETPLAGVTVSMLGKDGNGNTTGCTGGTVSDGAGNFVLVNLSAMCVGPQLVGFSGTTVTHPAGTYAGVNLAFTLIAAQVTASPILVHLPRIDNAETFYVQQNYAADQSYSYQTIPGLSVIAYAHTTFTMPDGTKPNPFPLAAVNVPVDRLPALKPQVPTMVLGFIVAFQPANASTNQPVAVYYPNTLNTPAGTNTALMTLDPTHGVMVPYGTASVANDGSQWVPDMDPAFPGHRFGLVHFDWHLVGIPLGSQMNPCAFCPIAQKGEPVDLSSGLAVIRETDISYGGARGSISITRTYRSGANQPVAAQYGPFGYGTNHNWGYELDSISPSTASVINLIMPDGNRFAFAKQPNGTFINSGIPAMGGGVMTANGNAVSLRWKDGTTFGFLIFAAPPYTRSLLDSVTDPNGNRFQIIHNGSQIQAIIDPTGRSLLFNYNNAGHITQITAPDGTFVSYDYRGNSGPVLRQVTRTDGSIVQYSYDNNNGLTSVTDNTGAVFASNTYDANQRVTQQRQANGGILTFAYTLQNPSAGMLSPVLATAVTDALGNQTVYRFSANGALIGVTDALGQTRTIDRDGGNYIVGLHGSGYCAECGDPAAGDQTFSYDDSTGNLLSHTDALGKTTTFAYEPVFNKVISTSDALGDTTRFTYDSHGNLLTETDPNRNITSFQYDQLGEVTQATDAANQKTFFSYDTFGNLVSIKDPVGDVTGLHYDANGRLTQIVDALGRNTAFGYDGQDRILIEANANAGITHFAYDTRGNLLSVMDAHGNNTTFTYNLMDDLLTRTDPKGRTDTRTYDLNENLVQFKDRRGQISTFSYDVINRLTLEDYQDGSTVARAYDANNRLADVNDSVGGVFAFAYDLAGRLASSTTPFGSVNYVRDALGRATSRQVAGQAAVTYTYDQVGNLAGAAMPQAAATFTYDARNQLSNISRMNGVSSAFTYDPVARLLAITHAKGLSVIDAESYAYDAAGNRASHSTSVGQPLITPAVATASYDGDNEQTQFGTTADAFDADGNSTSTASPSGTSSYIWDSRGRLKSITTSAGQTTNFTYDFAGNLIQQTDSGASLNLTQTFLLDDLTNVAYVNRSDGDQYSVLTGQSLDLHMAIVHASGQVEYGLVDGVNSTMATVDQTGSLKGQFLYEPFGQTKAIGSTYPFQYTGRVPVSSTLYYYRARFYNSQTGRFISEDPIGFGGGDANLYRYVFNSPSVYTDPFGLWAFGGTVGGSIEGGGEIATNGGSVALEGGASFSASRGVLFGPNGPSDIDFVSYGAFGRYQARQGSTVQCSSGSPFAAGGYAGLGVGGFLSNAKLNSDIAGPFDTYSLNLPFVSGSLGFGANGVFILNITAGASTPTYSISRYTTLTPSVITTLH